MSIAIKECRRCKCTMTARDEDYCTECLPIKVRELERVYEFLKEMKKWLTIYYDGSDDVNPMIDQIDNILKEKE